MKRGQPPRPPRRAVALRYDGRRAPSVTATGYDDIAEQIIALARQHEVPLFENPELVRLLSELELGEEIPEILYRCIAQVIAFAYSIQGRTPENWDQRWQDPGEGVVATVTGPEASGEASQ